MVMYEVVKMSKELKIFLDKKKRAKGETYDEVIRRMVRYGK